MLTKLDIMDRGTDAAAILRNEVVPLRLGYTGLVCRSQADIVARRSMRDARAAEQAFFESHPEYHEARALGEGSFSGLLRTLVISTWVLWQSVRASASSRHSALCGTAADTQGCK